VLEGSGDLTGERAFVPPDAVLTALGRQALSLVAQELRERAIAVLLAPDHYCPAMFVPFQLEGIRVHEVRTGSDCLMDADALAEAVRERPRAAVFHCETFGNLAGPALAETLAGVQARGLPVVVDQTHSLLGAQHFPGDYAVASLRKLLPVPDGAWVCGLTEVPELPRSPWDEAATDRFVDALDRQPGWLRLRLEAEMGIDDLWEPAAISPQAVAALGAIGTSELVEGRRANATRLLAALPHVTLLNPDATECCLALSHRRAEAIAEDLATHGILAPIQWTRPRRLRRARPWRTDVLTLPVDQWLDDEDVALIASSLAATT